MSSYAFFADSSPITTKRKQRETAITSARRWRLREAAQAIVDDRTSQQHDGNGNGSAGNTKTKDITLLMSADFDVDLEGQCDLTVIGRAFTLAARSVLHAMRQPQHLREGTQDDVPSRQHLEMIPHLPIVLQIRQGIRSARTNALQRSMDNKEWSKRRNMAAPVVAFNGNHHHARSSTNGVTPSNNVKKETRKSDANTPVADCAVVTSAPKFTRNTPASSAAALDHRFTNSRAILCAAGNIALTHNMADPADVPQKVTNLGAVVVDATVYGRRTLCVAENAVRRTVWRYQFRQEHYKAQRECQFLPSSSSVGTGSSSPFGFLSIPNLFMGKRRVWEDQMWEDTKLCEYSPNLSALTEAWESKGRAALQHVLAIGSGTVGGGAGHALYYDTEWNSRHGRLGDFIRSQARLDELSWGPHLIITTQPEIDSFCQEFYDWRTYLSLGQARDDTTRLRACKYSGSRTERRRLRKMWPSATGLPEDPIHVIVMSYASFLEDYLHVCQIPWGTVIVDDGASWMAASQGDPNSSLAALWEKAFWSTNDHYTGLAGTTLSQWDFELDDWKENLTADGSSNAIKDAYIGLTARHRILTASKLFLQHRQSVDLLPVSGVVNFVSPHFAFVVREEWDRNNISKDAPSMDHFRRLVARYTVVHHPGDLDSDMKDLAVQALEGSLPLTDEGPEALAPVEIPEEEFVSAEKVTFSRRACLGWLGPANSCLRYELGRADFQPILEIMKISTKHGHYCEEVTTASSMTTSGATGQVTGTMAYRMAVRCGRHFGSEQGLRQHISAQHAPPGTWLCRTCGSDCITSQARTHHERACGQPSPGSGPDTSGAVGAMPTVGQGGPKSGVGKKKSQRNSSGKNGAAAADEKAPDGSLRVPGYRGVWVNKQGKHFIKIENKPYPGKEGGDIMLFDTIDDAAKKYDEVIKARNKGGEVQLNFKADGTKNIYEDATSTAVSGVGGSAANVVPLLSVINIKDLPPDVKPLLRDPRQTSRTGGNSKRHVYAYRGVCRQARKGHDRWQSQISFMGVNHYLGTFDSEWDAAAIYAWAHLILYGEEATRQAQKEGEEAAAAYEQEKRDIAAGKIPEPPPKPENKKVLKKKEPKEKITGGKKQKEIPTVVAASAKNGSADGKAKPTKKRKAMPRDSVPAEKKARTDPNSAKAERDILTAVVSKGVSKAPVLGHRDILESLSDSDLRTMVSSRLLSVRTNPYCLLYPENFPSAASEPLRSCLSVQASREVTPISAAMLVGIPADIGWSFPDFITENGLHEDVSVVQILAVEYDDDGMNENFRSVIQGSVTIVGQASKRMMRQFQEIGGGNIGMGCGVGPLDCHIGGVPGTCSPRAACIRYDGDVFRITCLNDTDVVTLNGERLESGGEGSILHNYDVCSVGPRVFAFVLPSNK